MTSQTRGMKYHCDIWMSMPLVQHSWMNALLKLLITSYRFKYLLNKKSWLLFYNLLWFNFNISKILLITFYSNLFEKELHCHIYNGANWSKMSGKLEIQWSPIQNKFITWGADICLYEVCQPKDNFNSSKIEHTELISYR